MSENFEDLPISVRCGGCGLILANVFRHDFNIEGFSVESGFHRSHCDCWLTYEHADVDAAVDRWRRTGKPQTVRARTPLAPRTIAEAKDMDRPKTVTFNQPASLIAVLRCNACGAYLGQIWSDGNCFELTVKPSTDITVSASNVTVRPNDVWTEMLPPGCSHSFILDSATQVEEWAKRARKTKRFTKARLAPEPAPQNAKTV